MHPGYLPLLKEKMRPRLVLTQCWCPGGLAVIPQCNALREASGAEADRINTRIKKELVAAGVKARATDERRSCMAREAAKQAQRVENAAQVMQLPSWAKCGRLS